MTTPSGLDNSARTENYLPSNNKTTEKTCAKGPTISQKAILLKRTFV